LAAAGPLGKTETTGRCNSATSPDARKNFATLRARAALAGFELLELGDDGRRVFVLSRWNLTRELPDLDAVAAFLDRVQGRRHG